ncbi:uncharacterized protein LOC129909751 [Episyrphus balteatus]|uniref:uncharacterized protein LOC129909751 n=1 Tax=Episyrphus balteatus TaxID=286459 RepID=UPI002485559E|nr:uncharacterized protein LOC129909751 [Episyrphus balteatus]
MVAGNGSEKCGLRAIRSSLDMSSSDKKKIMPDCKIINIYGMTELQGIVASDEKVIGRTVKGGILKNGYLLKLIDAHGGNQLGPNEKGRLCLKSMFPLIGYFKNGTAYKEHLKGDGWFTTADYCYIDSDHLLNVVIRFTLSFAI